MLCLVNVTLCCQNNYDISNVFYMQQQHRTYKWFAFWCKYTTGFLTSRQKVKVFFNIYIFFFYIFS
uniref:Uncharacterized protein n=1 Tax=Anguilla anguilla TaxID=7936 RepID=A0A0E9QQ59_ANGAN